MEKQSEDIDSAFEAKDYRKALFHIEQSLNIALASKRLKVKKAECLAYLGKYHSTVWKFYNLPTTQILGEIKFGDSRSAISAISTHLEALNLDFYEFLHFLKAENDQLNKNSEPLKWKNGSFRTSRFSKINFT